MMEEALAMGQLDLGRYDMLPKLVASAGYQWRDKELITNSRDSVTGLPSLANPYISSDRSHTLTDLACRGMCSTSASATSTPSRTPTAC